MEPAEHPVVVISTHLDDAVLACAATISSTSGVVVGTVFTDAPPVERLDGWNHRTTGHSWAPDTQRVRRDEDEDALSLLGARAAWLGEFEAEYRPGGQDVGAIATRIASFLDGLDPAEVWVPLGLHHLDHVAVADAARRLIASSPSTPPGRPIWRIYLDVPYARTYPGHVSERLASLRDAGFTLDEHRVVAVSGTTKRDAVECYRTQLEGVRGEHPEFDRSLADDEESWRITRPAGADRPGSASTVG